MLRLIQSCFHLPEYSESIWSSLKRLQENYSIIMKGMVIVNSIYLNKQDDKINNYYSDKNKNKLVVTTSEMIMKVNL